MLYDFWDLDANGIVNKEDVALGFKRFDTNNDKKLVQRELRVKMEPLMKKLCQESARVNQKCYKKGVALADDKALL